MTRKRRSFGSKATLSMVAERAGVSPMTVSNVLNRKPNVTQAKQEAVMRAVEELGYRPNRAARSLARASHYRIGLLHSDMASSFLGEILLGSLRAANLHGAEIALWGFDPATSGSSLKAAESLISSGIDGMILPPPLCEQRDLLEVSRKSGVPTIALASGAGITEVASVRIDDEAAAYELTRLMLDKGHRRIGLVEFSRMFSVTASRHAGHARALAEAGLEVDPELVWSGRPNFSSGLEAAEHFLGLANRPTAIFSSSDDIAAAIVNYAHRSGLAVPEDLSVVGFDDAPIASQVWPPLTTIHQPISRMAELATERLLAALHEQREVPPEVFLVDYEIVERASLTDRSARG